MAKNFIDQEEKDKVLSYSDGFRFGFGFFIANLLGLTVISAIIAGITALLQQLR